MQSTQIEIPTIAGTPFAGGIYAGRYFIGDQPYALIVAHADIGELEETKWGGTKKVNGTASYCDGLANTQAMAKAGSALGKWAQDLRIGEYDDWYIPSRLEALVAFGELGDKGVFAEAWYWTSSQCASLPGYAWCQSVDDGDQGNDRKGDELRARAVRRLAL